MTQSDYEAEMNDQRKFLATMANGAAFEIDGEYYELVGGLIGNAGLTGYHLEFQIMWFVCNIVIQKNHPDWSAPHLLDTVV